MSVIKDKKTAPAPAPHQTRLFGRENYIWMAAGMLIMTIGFFIMGGGKSPDPNNFNKEDVYSDMRITIAPILIVAGLVIEIFAIVRKPKTNQ